MGKNPNHPEKYVVLRHLTGDQIGMCFWTMNTENNTHSFDGELWYEEVLFTDSEEEALRACGYTPPIREQGPTRQELIDCIKNLMGVFDTPVAKRALGSEFANEARQIGRDILNKI